MTTDPISWRSGAGALYKRPAVQAAKVGERGPEGQRDMPETFPNSQNCSNKFSMFGSLVDVVIKNTNWETRPKKQLLNITTKAIERTDHLKCTLPFHRTITCLGRRVIFAFVS